MDVSLDNAIVHIVFFGEADRFPAQPFEMCPEIPVLSFDMCRLPFRHGVFFLWDALLIGLPVIRAKLFYF